MTSNAASCACVQAGRVRRKDALQVFGRLREQCAILRLFVPDNLWPSFAEWHRQDDEAAAYHSICLLALIRGHLAEFTAAFHRFLTDGDRLRPDLRRQYIQDLQERWMLKDDPVARHRKSRILNGRLLEIHLAGWLDTDGWTITGLEALREGVDIEATGSGGSHAFEVKAIGTSDEGFESIVSSLHNEPAVRPLSPEGAANYLMFRAYEAAVQLANHASRRVAMLAIDGLSWHEFRFQLKED